jgi:hypothetical protein
MYQPNDCMETVCLVSVTVTFSFFDNSFHDVTEWVCLISRLGKFSQCNLVWLDKYRLDEKRLQQNILTRHFRAEK